MPGHFLTDLEDKEIPGKPDEHYLTAVLSYWSDVTGSQEDVPIGFSSDYASVPRAPLVYELFGGDIGGDPAAVLHDFLYSTRKYPRAKCDAVFHEALIACGVPAWKAWAMWAGVRAGGGSHYNPAPVKS